MAGAVARSIAGSIAIMNQRLAFVTGAAGFIGRRLIPMLTADGACRVRCLSRRALPADIAGGVDTVVGDLRDPASYRAALRGCDTVVHLAAVTGKAGPRDYFAVNEQGTMALLDACRQTGVQRFIFTSSIAATYQKTVAYHYADSKQRAERAVHDSGLNYVIVRPTIVLGKGSPIGDRLIALAALPLTPLFGDGSVRVQPIHVDDVAAFLGAMAGMTPLPDRDIDLGGPDVLTLEEMIRRIRRLVRGSDSPIVHLPARPTIQLLAQMERWLPLFLPITAGQLSLFVNDSIAAGVRLDTSNGSSMKTIDEMLRLMVEHG